ncbi:MAG: class I SAM-dependent methyltransferase [Candidatus Dojkabacteria bacterium]
MFYQKNTHSKETDPIDNGILETRGSLYRTIQELGFNNLEDLLNFIEGGNVLNLGSGGGGFGVDFEVLKKIREQQLGIIYSINPRHGLHSQEQLDYFFDLSSLKKHYTKEIAHLADADLNEIHTEANEINITRTSAESWEHLSFPDEFFDKIIATGSYIYYPATFTESSFLEICRVLKKGGEMRIGLDSFNLNMKLINSIIDRIKELDLNIQVELLTSKDIHNLDVYFFKIVKLS